MHEFTMDPSFWDDLQELRNVSRLVLAALETGDLDRVESLARRSEDLIGHVRPVIEVRARATDRTEDDDRLTGVVEDLEAMNDRVLEVLAEKRDEALELLGAVRGHRLRLAHYRSGQVPEPELVNRDG